MSNQDKDIKRWHDTITPSSKAPQPWTVKSGGSWDMLDVQPIPDEMLSELMRRYHSAGSPWNCKSMPLSPSDREYMFLLYYSMQGLVARMRKAEAAAQDIERRTLERAMEICEYKERAKDCADEIRALMEQK